ncbi:MAG: TetR/AcrR family transcriptional regulator [Candidatus Riflebacteria bacterium]|nr:TetR/AcrR family transcriptional regulator [Candidatus Riflebacteria bacterium]
MSQKNNKRDLILDSVEEVIAEEGFSNLTLDAVAAKAGISKGGLLYHFPSKQSLVNETMERLMKQSVEELGKAKNSLPDKPGRELKAFILSRFREIKPKNFMSALISAIFTYPELHTENCSKYRTMMKESLLNSGVPAAKALMIMLAVDGMWLGEFVQENFLSEIEKKSVTEEMLKMIDEAVKV